MFFLAPITLFACNNGGGGSGNRHPSVDAGSDQSISGNSLVTLSGSSSDSDGTVVKYEWQQLEGPEVVLSSTDEIVTTFTSPVVTQPTTLVFQLSATDNDGATGSDTVSIIVSDENLPPTANAGPDQSLSIDPSQEITVSLPGSGNDQDGNIVAYSWSQTQGTSVSLLNADTDNASFIAPTNISEALAFELTVTDNGGATGSDEVVVYLTQPLLSDDFSNGNVNGWTTGANIVDDSSHTSSWQIVNNEYLLQDAYVESVIGGTPFDQSYHRGTYTYFSSGLNWDNYRLSLDITPLLNNQSSRPEGNDVGVMFRTDATNNNYYRLTINARYGFTRLEKKVGGVFSPLAVDSKGYEEGVAYNVIIDVKDQLIQVFIDNEPYFSVTDSDLSTGTIALYCQDRTKFDNIMVSDNSLAPSVVISTPSAYSIGTTDSTTLSVRAEAGNVPTGGYVEFVLDDNQQAAIVDQSAPFEADFMNVGQGDHRIDAILYNESDQEIAWDTNEIVGVLGGYLFTVGNSITNGSGDNYSADNVSQDGRTIGIQGYQAKLNDLLTQSRAYPHIVFNEGIGGDTSSDSLGRINSMLDRHVLADEVLILLGTNDVGKEIPSAQFQQNMQNIIDAINSAGKTAFVATIPPQYDTLGNPVNTSIIATFNTIVGNLTGKSNGPDLNTFFANNNGMFSDELHPNGLGHLAISHLWADAITGGGTDFFVLKNFSAQPLYQQNLLEVGDTYYIDEAYTVSSIPTELNNGIWIMTADADAGNSDTEFISFDVDRNATVYIAYASSGGVTLPDWLSGFLETGLQIGTSNGGLDLFSKGYSGGETVSLGGNNSGGGTGTSNYIVVVVEN